MPEPELLYMMALSPAPSRSMKSKLSLAPFLVLNMAIYPSRERGNTQAATVKVPFTVPVGWTRTYRSAFPSKDSALLKIPVTQVGLLFNVPLLPLPVLLVALVPTPSSNFHQATRSGETSTVRVAAVEVALPPLLLKTARYCLLLSNSLVIKVSVALVAPLILANVAPPSVLTCHCTVGAGLPLAAVVKLTVWPA